MAAKFLGLTGSEKITFRKRIIGQTFNYTHLKFSLFLLKTKFNMLKSIDFLSYLGPTIRSHTFYTEKLSCLGVTVGQSWPLKTILPLECVTPWSLQLQFRRVINSLTN